MGNRNNNSEKMQAKPPSGRRHSTTGNYHYNQHKNLDHLPPRLRRKYLEENGLSEDSSWDGSSTVFQASI